MAANSPVKTVADLAAAAAKRTGVTFASAGNGTSGHLADELMPASVKLDIVDWPLGGLQRRQRQWGGDLTLNRCDPEAPLKRTQLASSHKPCVGALDSPAIGPRQRIAACELRR